MKLTVRLSFILIFFVFLWSCQNTDPLSNDPSETEEIDFSRQESDDQTESFHGGIFDYEITIENLTPATGPGASQPLSPPVVATHSPFYKLFKVGRYASPELVQVAEDAVNGPLVEKLSNSRRVYDVQQGDGVILPGTSATINISSKSWYKKVSLVSMLVNTNDAFAGMNSVWLPKHGSRTIYLWAFDAGSEKNTESVEHIPGPCCGSPLMRVPTHERIRFHRGIKGVGDLDPAVYGWKRVVAKVTIKRIY